MIHARLPSSWHKCNKRASLRMISSEIRHWWAVSTKPLISLCLTFIETTTINISSRASTVLAWCLIEVCRRPTPQVDSSITPGATPSLSCSSQATRSPARSTPTSHWGIYSDTTMKRGCRATSSSSMRMKKGSWHSQNKESSRLSKWLPRKMRLLLAKAW